MGWGSIGGWTSSLSTAVNWATAGASLVGPQFAWLGASVGALFGLGVGMANHNTESDKIIDAAKDQRKQVTQTRNRYIRDFRRLYDQTRTDFDTTYGAGLFDTLETDFKKILNLEGSDTLANVLGSLSYDSVSGEITDRLFQTKDTNGNSRFTEEDYKIFTSQSFNVKDFGQEYVRVLEERLRAADTQFGLQMQSLSQQEREAISGYESAMAEMNIAIAQNFQNAFMSRLQESQSEQLAMGDASLRQATSGIRQTDSGRNLTVAQQFQQDLSKVAYVTTLNMLYESTLLSAKDQARNMMSNIYQTRNSIAIGTVGQVNALNKTLQDWQEQQIGAADVILDAEHAVDSLNETIDDTADGKFGWWNGSDDFERAHDAQDIATGELFG